MMFGLIFFFRLSTILINASNHTKSVPLSDKKMCDLPYNH